MRRTPSGESRRWSVGAGVRTGEPSGEAETFEQAGQPGGFFLDGGESSTDTCVAREDDTDKHGADPENRDKLLGETFHAVSVPLP